MANLSAVWDDACHRSTGNAAFCFPDSTPLARLGQQSNHKRNWKGKEGERKGKERKERKGKKRK